jgi:ABC-2 type transport system ATP-binding protein
MDRHTTLAQLRQAGKRYGNVQALQGIDLTLHAGEVLALLGPNGAGKTTAIGLLLGLMRPDVGTASLFGLDPQSLQARRGIGVMLQDAALPATLRVGELIRLTSSYYPAPRALHETAELAGVADLLQRPYGKLSGGQQRRVQFALALCGRPRVLFLDEPTVGLDLASRRRLWAAIRQLVGEGNAVLLTTHYLEEAEALADRVCMLARGRVVSEGSVDALRARVSLKQVRCTTRLDIAGIGQWPEVVEVRSEGDRMWMSTTAMEALVRRLLDADPGLSSLEVHAAGLADAFTQITSDADTATGSADVPPQREAA